MTKNLANVKAETASRLFHTDVRTSSGIDRIAETGAAGSGPF